MVALPHPDLRRTVVSTHATRPYVRPVRAPHWRSRRAAAAAETRRLATLDRLAARRAELYFIHALLEDASTVVSRGWVQHGWFAVSDARGELVTLGAQDIHLTTGREVSGACLVGAVVHAAGGPSVVHTQLVQRTLDLVWHTLHEDPQRAVRWCPGPSVRAAHLRDLTRWNDAPGRTAFEVTALLTSALEVVSAQTERLGAA
jgi:hypothetical protein